ncbi:hypothetical protein [Clostridiisalibacter paucivorans]|uniref:hypothetical protein n=1 Tax=Clostridiisalibacter paucivorans TaxID=408753 RepID=UPI00047BFDAE|nr:hypothetical protein [Clostridiisalibacter paucivorans]
MYLSTILSEKEMLHDLFISEKQLYDSYKKIIKGQKPSKLDISLSQCILNLEKNQYSLLKAMNHRGWK